jgi:hypothetical protein
MVELFSAFPVVELPRSPANTDTRPCGHRQHAARSWTAAFQPAQVAVDATGPCLTVDEISNSTIDSGGADLHYQLWETMISLRTTPKALAAAAGEWTDLTSPVNTANSVTTEPITRVATSPRMRSRYLLPRNSTRTPDAIGAPAEIAQSAHKALQ